MGFRFSLQSANTVANLTIGNIRSCYRDIFESWESINEFKTFIDTLENNFYSNDDYCKYILREIQSTLQDCFESNRVELYNKYCNDLSCEPEIYDECILEALDSLSTILRKCKIKALLLSNNNYLDYNFMNSKRMLKRLVRIHPGDSCLILQPDEETNSPTIFNAFPHFEIALRQFDLWPAILFWDDEDNAVFIPVDNGSEIDYLFNIIKYEYHPIKELQRYAAKKHVPQKYLVQLSDLHFGHSTLYCGQSRIRTLMKKEINKIMQQGSAKVIVTGDAIDSPIDAYENMYNDFSEYIKLLSGEKPIRVLGNHDINHHGIALSKRNQKIAALTSEFPKLLILEEEKIILLLFNSNTEGNFACGKIGPMQMTKMGNALDEINNLSTYKLIAVLHHHIVNIPRPDDFAKRLFENVWEQTLILKDADIFMKWLKQRNVSVILHGHKHIPFYTEANGIKIIACGSSTGQVKMKEKGTTCISYNIIKINKDKLTCSQVVENILGGEQHIKTQVITF